MPGHSNAGISPLLSLNLSMLSMTEWIRVLGSISETWLSTFHTTKDPRGAWDRFRRNLEITDTIGEGKRAGFGEVENVFEDLWGEVG